MAQGPHKTLIGFKDLEQPDDTVRAVSTGEPLPVGLEAAYSAQLLSTLTTLCDIGERILDQLAHITDIEEG